MANAHIVLQAIQNQSKETNMTQTASAKVVFPAGKYWIGDPCYAIRDEDWPLVLEQTGYFGGDRSNLGRIYQGSFIYQGQRCFAWGTAYGDGEFRGSDGFDYGVDAGLLGLLPEKVVNGDYAQGGKWHVFGHTFEVYCSGGKFQFGHVTVDTADEGDDQE